MDHRPKERVLILANPKSGSGPGLRHVTQLVKGLTDFGLDTTVCHNLGDFDGQLQCWQAEMRCVVAAGGDGTLGEVLNRAPGLPVAMLPLGTENLVARHFGFDREASGLARRIAANRHEAFDLGQGNGRIFSLLVSAGFDSHVVHQLHRGRHGHINHLSYVLPILGALQDYDFPPIQVEIVETGERLTGSLVMVFNLPRYAIGLPIASQARDNDGFLDLWVFERPGVMNLIRYAAAVLCGHLTKLRDVKHRLVQRVRLRSDRPVPLQMDGDPAGTLPMDIAVLPGAMQVMMPGS